MKKFLQITVIGLVVFLSLCAFAEFYQPKVTNRYSYKHEYMEKQRGGIKTLILGNSYMENAFNPKILGDSIFELAMSGRWIYYDYMLLGKYISDMDNLQTVIFGMGYAHPFYQSYHLSDKERTSSFNAHEIYMYDKFLDIKYGNSPIQWLGLYRGYITLRSLCDTCSCDSLGYEKVEGQSSNWTEEHNITPNVIEGPLSKDNIKEYTEYLKGMAYLCHLHNVRFIVITPPCHASYIVNVREEGLEILHKMIETVRSDYPIEYYNYLQDKEFRADSIYYNCSHLNSIGADMFALRVKKDFGL